ncbi:hypothetical protein DMA11_12330 [Marinilabiliaceae bacterium JC017]|nr:hypothetical protein DMA11_12330 [Marinilabiliaceae bacterium JC017]
MVVKPSAVRQVNGIELVEPGKNDVVIFHRSGIVNAVLCSEGLFGSLVFGTVVVVATVVANAFLKDGKSTEIQV